MHRRTLSTTGLSPDVVDALCDWHVECWGPEGESANRDFYNDCLTGDTAFAVVLYENDSPVASAGALCHHDGRVWLVNVIVRKDLQGQGLGGEVLNAIKYKARARGESSLWVWTDHLSEWYSGHGYELVAEAEHLGQKVDVLVHKF